MKWAIEAFRRRGKRRHRKSVESRYVFWISGTLPGTSLVIGEYATVRPNVSTPDIGAAHMVKTRMAAKVWLAVFAQYGVTYEVLPVEIKVV